MCKIIPRIKQIALNEGLTIGAIERKIGASKGVISRAITNGTDIQSKWLQAIVENYPQYSAQWLLTGKGDMLATDSFQRHDIQQQEDFATVKPYQEYSDNKRGAIPLVYEKAIGGFLNNEFSIAERDVIAYYTIPKFRNLGVDFMIELYGDSMIPRLFPGDIIACSIITNPNFIQWNKCHLIASREQGLLVKRLMPGENKATLKAVSENPSYPSFDIPKDDICGLALIVGSIRLD